MRILPAAVIACCAWAQPPVDIHPVKGTASERCLEAKRRVQVIERLQYREPSAPEEVAILAIALYCQTKSLSAWQYSAHGGVPDDACKLK